MRQTTKKTRPTSPTYRALHHVHRRSQASITSERSLLTSNYFIRSSSHTNSPVLGDFTFSSDEEFQDYYAIVTGQVSGSASPSTFYFSTSSSSSSSSKPSKKTSSSASSKTRKGSSAFFLSGSSFSSSPSLSPSLASQNPELSRAHSKLSQKMRRLASLSYKAEQREENESAEEDVQTRFERALMFADWTRNENGQWQTPAGANENLVRLVSQAL